MENNKPCNIRSNIKEGVEVAISLRKDRTGKSLIQGKVKKILTNSDYHTHGIMVELDNGEVGRVCDILSSPSVDAVLNISNSPTTIEDVIKSGESHYVEFKSSALWSKDLTQEEINVPKSNEIKNYRRDASKFIIARTMAAFLNSDGGAIVIGIKENKERNGENELIGIDGEFNKLKDSNVDGYRRMIVDEILRKYLPSEIVHHIAEYITISFPLVDGMTLCWIRVKRSDRNVFIKTSGKEPIFFIKLESEIMELKSNELVDYCKKRFSS